MTRAKFHLGDRVRFNGRVPTYLKRGKRSRTRTIVAVEYDANRQACLYCLGCNNKQNSLDGFSHFSPTSSNFWGYAFRSYQLISISNTSRGRPKTKRHYVKYDKTLHNVNLDTKILEGYRNRFDCQEQGKTSSCQ